MLVASTAHYSKFVEECKDTYDEIGLDTSTVVNPAPHEGIENCKTKPMVHVDILDADYQQICQTLETFVKNYFG